MSIPYVMRRAQPDDLDRVMEVLNARRQWLSDQGSRQWSTMAFRPRMAAAIERGETWLLTTRSTGEPTATLTLTTVGNTAFWSPHELAKPALYLSKIATAPQYAGSHLGRLVVNWAVTYGLERGISRLRWDSWRSNTALHAYWQRIGAQHLRTEDAPKWNTGALFELAFTQPRSDLTSWITSPPALTEVCPLSSASIPRPAPTPYDLESLESSSTDHDHDLAGIETGDGTPLRIPAADFPALLRDSGDGWYAWANWPQRVTCQAGTLLQSGQVHQVRHSSTKAGCYAALYADADRHQRSSAGWRHTA